MAELTRLANGVTVAIDPMEGAQSASIGLYAAVGSRSEPDGKGGLAHLVEHERHAFPGDVVHALRGVLEEDGVGREVERAGVVVGVVCA